MMNPNAMFKNILRLFAHLVVFASLLAGAQESAPQPGKQVQGVDRRVNRDVTVPTVSEPKGRPHSSSPASKWGPTRTQPTPSQTSLNEGTSDQQKAPNTPGSSPKVTRVESRPNQKRPALSTPGYVAEDTSHAALKSSGLTKGISTTADTRTFAFKGHAALAHKKKKQERPSDQSDLGHRKQSLTGSHSKDVKSNRSDSKSPNSREKRIP